MTNSCNLSQIISLFDAVPFGVNVTFQSRCILMVMFYFVTSACAEMLPVPATPCLISILLHVFLTSDLFTLCLSAAAVVPCSRAP